MTTEEQIALASAGIAALSLLFNVGQAVVIHRLKRRNLKRDAVVDVLRSLLQKLEYTRLFDVDVNQEIWEFGFVTLRDLAAFCAAAHVTVQHSRFAEQDLRAVVSQLHVHVKSLRAFQDSWETFRHGKDGPVNEIQLNWPEIEQAKAALQAAQPIAQNCRRTLQRFLDVR
jgi:hypothetical protein